MTVPLAFLLHDMLIILCNTLVIPSPVYIQMTRPGQNGQCIVALLFNIQAWKVYLYTRSDFNLFPGDLGLFN